MWRVAENILSKQPRTAIKDLFSSVVAGVGEGACEVTLQRLAFCIYLIGTPSFEGKTTILET
jgi:hypothetical protein